MSYDPNESKLVVLNTSVERLKQYLAIKYGMSIQDLVLREPALGPVLEFFTLEVDALNARIDSLETQIKNDNTDDYPPYGVMF